MASNIIIKKGPTTIVVSPEYSQTADFIASLPAAFANGEGRPIHQGRNEIREFEVCGLRLAAKRYKTANAFQRVGYTLFSRTKARKAFEFAAEMRRRGIDTPREVAYIEQKRHGLFAKGYFVCLECNDPPAFHKLVEEPQFDKNLASALAAFIAKMHSKGILHGDLNLGNFLYRPDGKGSFSFTVIDTNRSKFCDGWPTRQQCLRNLVTTTHRRDLFRFIAGRYAEQRGWQPQPAIAEAEALLDDFEQRHRRKDIMKKAFRH